MLCAVGWSQLFLAHFNTHHQNDDSLRYGTFKKIKDIFLYRDPQKDHENLFV